MTTELLVQRYREFLRQTNEPVAAAILAIGSGQQAPLKSDWLTVAQAAREFNLSSRAIYRLTDLHRRNGKSVRIKRSELQAYLEGEADLLD
jgi:excisionase family DNA binding protein